MALLEEFPEMMVLGDAICGKNGLPLIYNYLPRLVFVNLDLPDMSGFEIANILQNKNFNPRIIFLANDEDLAFDALPYEPFDFFVKPVQKKHIKEMLERYKLIARKEMLNDKMDSFARNFYKESKRVFSFNQGIIVLKLDEIVYCKADRTKSILVLKDGEEIALSTGISETIEVINDNRFLKCSRSYLINRNYLRKIDKRRHKCILYNDGNSWEIPVSRNSEKLLETLLTYPIS